MTDMNEKDLFDPEEEAVIETITLDFEDGGSAECEVLLVFPLGDKEYIALNPLDENGELDVNEPILLYRFIDHGDDEDPEILDIETDEEFEAAGNEFDRICEMITEEDEEDEEDEDK